MKCPFCDGELEFIVYLKKLPPEELKYLDVDPVVVRLVWAVAALVSMGLGILAYVAAWVIIPEEPSGRRTY